VAQHVVVSFHKSLTYTNNVGKPGLIEAAAEGKSSDIIASAMLVPEPDGVAIQFAFLAHHDYAHHGSAKF
jgi:hypothetical protein